jgi:hypothetical protein
MDSKVCRHCKFVLSLDNCRPSKLQRGDCICRDCENTAVRARRGKNVHAVRAKNNAYHARCRKELLAAYGGHCVCCGEDTPEFLTIDHINNDGATHRRRISGRGRGYNARVDLWLRRNGCPKDNFQLLCMNCNFAKGKYGSCPHARFSLLALCKEAV